MKLDLLDIVASILGPVLAVILLVGVVKVRLKIVKQKGIQNEIPFSQQKNHHYLLTFLFLTMFSMVIYALDTLLDSFAHPWTNMFRFFLIGNYFLKLLNVKSLKLSFLSVLYMYFWLCVQSLYQTYRRLDPDYQYLLAQFNYDRTLN